MRKLFTFILSVTLVFMMGTTTLADIAISDEQARAYELIEKTNAKINEKIEKAVEEAEKLKADYLLKLRKLEEGVGLGKLKKQKEDILATLMTADLDESSLVDTKRQLAEIENKIVREEIRIEDYLRLVEIELMEITALVIQQDSVYSLENAKAKFKGKTFEDAKAELHEKYMEKLWGIVNRVYEETLKMSTRTIDKVFKVGVIAECSWVLVRFADIEIEIDPIKVVGV